MGSSGIQITKFEATRVDDDGKALRLRVGGTAQQRQCSVFVELFPERASQENHGTSSLDFGARETARFLSKREAKQLLLPTESTKAVLDGDPNPPPVYPWCAEFDLTLHPKFPPLYLGVLNPRLIVRALYLRGGPDDVLPVDLPKDSLQLAKEFPLGVLFVHGIGEQTRSETLSSWTAPLLNWINGWFTASSRHLAERVERAQGAHAEGWLSALTAHESWSHFDKDASERSAQAASFVTQVMHKHYDTDTERMVAGARRTLQNSSLRVATAEQLSACNDFERYLNDKLGVAIVSGNAVLADARLIDGDAPADRPSTVELRIATLAASGQVERIRWLVAESWWAESFRAPAFGPFMIWCLGSVPAIWVHYYAMLFERGRRARWRGLLTLLPLTTIVLLTVLGMLAVWILAIVPVERLRAALLSTQRLLAGVVGDSHIFLNDRVQSRAIVDRVRRDVEWLSQRCTKVVVVAHSQGVAVAHQAVNKPSEYQPKAMQALISLGGGKQTLQRLAQLRERAQVRWVGWLALAGGALVWAGVAVALRTANVPLGGGLFMGGFVAMACAASTGWKLHPGLQKVPIEAASVKPWFDFFATHDPVPMGPMISPDTQAPLYHPHPVDNLSSYLADHTSYWKNPEQVVGPVAQVLSQIEGADFLQASVRNRVALEDLLSRSRKVRVRWLRVARTITLFTTLGIAWLARGALGDLKDWAVSATDAKVGIPTTTYDFPGFTTAWHAAWIGAPAMLYAGVVVSVWEAWGAAERRACLRAQRGEIAASWLWLFAASVAAIPALTPAVALSAGWTQAGGAWLGVAALFGGTMHLLVGGAENPTAA